MYRSLAIFTGCLIALNLSACSNGQSRQDSDSNGSSPPKLAWPHSRPLNAKEEEEFNTRYTTLEGTLNNSIGDPARSQWHIYINENKIDYVIPSELYSRFDSKAFEQKMFSSIKEKGKVPKFKFLVEHLEAEQPHADPKTGKLTMKIHGLIVNDDNIDLIKSQN